MANGEIYQRVFMTCPARWLGQQRQLRNFAEVKENVFRVLGVPSSLWDGADVVGIPSQNFELYGVDNKLPEPEREVVQLRFTRQTTLDSFVDRVHTLSLSDPENAPQAGADLPFNVSDYVDYWCPVGSGASFGVRRAAIRQIKADKLPPLDGSGVNIVLVDRGIGRNVLPPANKGFGWIFKGQLPFTAIGDRAEHSAMLIRDILAIAPAARFFDMPLIPPRVEKVPSFLADAYTAFAYAMKFGIPIFNLLLPGRWVIVNAWATFDLRSDHNLLPLRYRDNPAHPFHGAVTGLVNDGYDVIFAAGNCGQFCPDDRCGPGDIGHGNSISGANGYQEVLSVGAVRADGLALGYSSQGLGRIAWPGADSAQKPDISAPSQYCLETDPGRISSGTSAACGIAAGVVAALRTRSIGTGIPPANLIAVLRTTAGGAYDPQFGCGMLNAEAARMALGI
jgi:Subtilase family